MVKACQWPFQSRIKVSGIEGVNRLTNLNNTLSFLFDIKKGGIYEQLKIKDKTLYNLPISLGHNGREYFYLLFIITQQV